MNLKNSATFRREEIKELAAEEVVDLEYIDEPPPRSGRSEPARTPLQPIGGGNWHSAAKTQIWAFPDPSQDAEGGGRRPGPDASRPREVSVLAMVAVGAAPVQSRAEPAFSPVPNRKRSSQANARAEPLLVLPSVRHPPPGREARGLSPASAGPLLRAFDAVPSGAATWSTAQTLVARLPRGQGSPGDAEAQVGSVERTETDSRLPSPPQRLILELRQRSGKTMKIAALVLAAAVLVGAGLFAARNGLFVARGAVEAAVADSAVAAVRAPDPTGSNVAVRAIARVESEESQRPPAGNLNADKPRQASVPVLAAPLAAASTSAAEVSVSGGATLARQAVDALLAGDRPRALLYYRELSRAAPDRDVYRAAVRLLTPAASDPSHSTAASNE